MSSANKNVEGLLHFLISNKKKGIHTMTIETCEVSVRRLRT